jgi:hypothetical protein
MTTMAAVPESREALLGPAAQRLEIGLLGARTAAVLRRVSEGSEIDDLDRAVLHSAMEMLETAADAVDFVAAGGALKRDRRSFGFSAMAFTVELAAPAVSAADLPLFLRSMVSDLRQLQNQNNVEVAGRLLPAFSTLADVATRQAGNVGEGGGSLL